MSEMPSWAHALLHANGAERIESTVAEAESRTSGEIVPMLVRRSSTVGHIPLVSFSLLLLGQFLFDLPGRLAELTGPYWLWLAISWIVAGGLAVGLSRLAWVQRNLTPRSDQIHQVNLRAQLEFFEHGITETEGQTGVLLFVSAMEHRAVVLADKGIADKVDATVWQELVEMMIAGVKRGDLSAGMNEAIARCGELLSPHFPVAEGDVNELRDHLIVKE